MAIKWILIFTCLNKVRLSVLLHYVLLKWRRRWQWGKTPGAVIYRIKFQSLRKFEPHIFGVEIWAIKNMRHFLSSQKSWIISCLQTFTILVEITEIKLHTAIAIVSWVFMSDNLFRDKSMEIFVLWSYYKYKYSIAQTKLYVLLHVY